MGGGDEGKEAASRFRVVPGKPLCSRWFVGRLIVSALCKLKKAHLWLMCYKDGFLCCFYFLFLWLTLK